MAQAAAVKTEDDFLADGHTPMMAQYHTLKSQYPDCLLFYRMGDFYELFFDDAEKAAAILDITLTRRGKTQGTEIPMAGVPFHSYEPYLARLIRAGHKVAICEQVETPEEAKKRGGHKALVARDVIRVVTPGTLTEDHLLEARENNYLAALAEAGGQFGLAWLELSTGEFLVQPLDAPALTAALERVAPREILIPEPLAARDDLAAFGPLLTPQPASLFDSMNGQRRLESLFGVGALDGLGGFGRAEIAAAGALVDYVERTQKGQIPHLSRPRQIVLGAVMEIDAATRRNLELTRTLSGERKGSLLSVIDRTVTGAGARLLQSRLSAPLTDPDAIDRRLDLVGAFAEDARLRDGLRAALKETPDMERALSRLSAGRGSPRDLAALRDGLRQAERIGALLPVLAPPSALLPQDTSPLGRGEDSFDESSSPCAAFSPPPWKGGGREGGKRVEGGKENEEGGNGNTNSNTPFSPLAAALWPSPEIAALADLLKAALLDDPPALARDGGFIRRGFHARLDELKGIRENSRRLMLDLESLYKTRTGIDALKITHNNILGYYIEVPAKKADALLIKKGEADNPFVHRQTMANAVRFTTPDLSALERDMEGAEGRALAIELELFAELTAKTSALSEEIGVRARALAALDVASGLADLAVDMGYTRPVIEQTLAFSIEGGRHPVVEHALRAQSAGAFTPNECDLSPGQRLWLLTGPNMAGKSTFLRQNALIAILAQAGSFVPAKAARIGLVDRCFSRVGASDDLARGHSTFMVEMVETAAILNQATERSLVILDEIGRGTATFDGLSIAWACVEHLHEKNRCRALFATHYHELTRLQSRLPSLSCHSMQVREWKGDIVFLHAVGPGAADRSYGVHVARLAGLPSSVVARAQEVLSLLENGEQSGALARLADDLPLFTAAPKAPQAAVPSAPSPLLEKLAAVNPDALTPRDALDLIYALKALSETH